MMKKLRTVGAQITITHLDKDEITAVTSWLNEEKRDLEIDDFGRDSHLLESPKDAIALIKKSLIDYDGRLGIHGPVPVQSFAISDPVVAKVIEQRYKQALDICGAIGASHMVIHSPFLYLGGAMLPYVDAIAQTKQHDLALSMLEKIVPKAEQVGCTLVIENAYDETPDFILRLVKAVASDYVRQSVDIGHAYVQHMQRNAPPPDYWIRAIGNYLGHIHLQDTDGFADRHWQPGQGQLNWHALFKEIGDLDCHPRLILELGFDIRGSIAFRKASAWFGENNWAK